MAGTSPAMTPRYRALQYPIPEFASIRHARFGPSPSDVGPPDRRNANPLGRAARAGRARQSRAASGQGSESKLTR